MNKTVSISSVFRALSDEKSYNLFNTIFNNDTASQVLYTNLGLSKRQYYNRISELRSAGLIGKQKGKYIITSLGKVIYSILKIGERAIDSNWKLQAIDMINFSANVNSVAIDYVKIMNTLLDDIEIKEILLQDNFPSVTSKDPGSYRKSKHMVSLSGKSS